MHTHTHLKMYARIHIHICIYIYTFMYTYIHTYLCVFVNLYDILCMCRCNVCQNTSCSDPKEAQTLEKLVEKENLKFDELRFRIYKHLDIIRERVDKGVHTHTHLKIYIYIYIYIYICITICICICMCVYI